MKRISVFILALTIAASLCFLAGCGDRGSRGSGESRTLTVYTPHNAEQYNAAIKEFQELTGIEVMVVAMGTGDCLQRIAAESARPLCDVMWGGTTESMEAYKEYFEPFVSSENAFIPAHFRSRENLWIGESQQPAVIMYNKDLVSESDIPREWSDLLDPKWRGRIASANPASSGSAYTLIATMIMARSPNRDYEQGWRFIEQLAQNLVITGGSSAVFRGVAAGEFALGLTLEQLAFPSIRADPNRVGMIYPSDGSSNVPDGVAIVKGAPNPENAARFINFLLSRDCQNMMNDTFGRRSIRTDIPQPTALPDLNTIFFLDYDFEWAGNGRAAVLNRWEIVATTHIPAGR